MALDPITGGEELATSIATLIGKFVPDPNQRAQIELETLKTVQSWDAIQSDVNKTEAANASIFVAGARPFILWVCGAALAYQYLARPIALWVGFLTGHPIPDAPSLDGNLWELMAGMLGMAGWRSFDKAKGVATTALGG